MQRSISKNLILGAIVNIGRGTLRQTYGQPARKANRQRSSGGIGQTPELAQLWQYRMSK